MRSTSVGSILVSAFVAQLAQAASIYVPSDAENAIQLVNLHRSSHEVAPLTWSESLAHDAATWAAHLKATDQVVHATEDQRANQGEVLAYFTSTAAEPLFQPITSAAQNWLAGGAHYPAGGVVGDGTESWNHWSQLMWSTSTEVGCGIAEIVQGAETKTFVVCRLTPEGNIIGQPPFPAAVGRRQDMGKGPYNGDLTHFTTGLGACGFDDTGRPRILALSHEKMGPRSNDNPLCNKRVKLEANGRAAYATIRDKCMGCKFGDVDVSEDVFKALYGDLGIGRAPVKWELLD